MPTVSKAQQKLMLAAAHTKGGYGGVPEKVGKEFVKADKKAGKLKKDKKEQKILSKKGKK